MRIADWERLRPAPPRDARKRGKLLGRGLANYVESSIGAPHGAGAASTVRPEGRVDVVIGTQPSRAGSRDELRPGGVGPARRRPPNGCASSWATPTWCRSAAARIRAVPCAMPPPCSPRRPTSSSTRAGASPRSCSASTPDRIAFKDGRFVRARDQPHFDLLELAEEAARQALPDDLAGGLAVVTDNEMHDPVFPNGCAICEVEIDPETGAVEITRYASVDDVGRCINPLIVHGQTHGAIAQGVGQALWEQCYLDPRFGPAARRLADGLRHAALRHRCRRSSPRSPKCSRPTNPLGIKAGGEGGTTAAPAVIVSAHRRCAQALRH